MLKKFNIWKKSIFARLLLTFLIIILPVYFIAFNIYNWGINTIKAEILNSKSAQLSSFLGSLENDIQRIKILQSDLLLSDDLNRLANSEDSMTEYEKSRLILLVQKRLNAIWSSSSYISDVVAILPSIHKAIPAVGGITDIVDEDGKMLEVYDQSTYSQIALSNNLLYINAFFPLYSTTRKTPPAYGIELKLSSKGLQSALKQFDYYKEDGTLLFRNNGDFSISTGNDPALSKQLENVARKHLGSDSTQVDSVRVNGRKYLVIFKSSNYLGMTICSYIPETILYRTLTKYQIWFWLLSIVAAVIIALFSFFTYKFIQQPMKKLIKAFKRLETGDMDFTLKHGYDDEFEYLYERFNEMLQRLNTTIDQVYRQKIMIQRAELKQLQAQINPHFLYNSFFILYTMSKRGENESLEQFAMQLGEYFQFVTRSGADEVPLSREVSHARTYCDIQSTRFSNRIRVLFEAPPEEWLAVKVPRLIIQPIIENAFEHGLEQKEENGLLQIRFRTTGTELYIDVEDNGEQIRDEDIVQLQEKLDSGGNEKEMTGILNIHSRIRLKFGEDSGIKVSRGELGGLLVTIHITYEKGEYQDVQALDRG